MAETRLQLKARFSSGQRIGEADFHTLIESLAHLNEDIVSGELATGESVTSLSSKVDELKAFAEAHKSDFDDYKGNQPTLEQVEARDNQVLDTISTDITALGNLINATKSELQANDNSLATDIQTQGNEISSLQDNIDQLENDLSTLASDTALESLRQTILGLLDGKANTSHIHTDYALTTDLQNYATQADINSLPQQGHTHTLADIDGIEDEYLNEEQVQELIELNRHKIDFSILYDEFYTKADVDEKIRISFGLFEDKIIAVINAKIDQLQESINNLTPPNPYTLYNIDPVEAESISGVEASTVSIGAVSPITGLVLAGTFNGAVLPEVSISSPGNYNSEIFIGITNEDQVIAYNELLGQWEWIELTSSGQKMIATKQTTDYSYVPDYWHLDPDGDYGTTGTEQYSITVEQTSDSDLVDILETARFISVGYVGQGLNYVKKAL